MTFLRLSYERCCTRWMNLSRFVTTHYINFFVGLRNLNFHTPHNIIMVERNLDSCEVAKLECSTLFIRVPEDQLMIQVNKNNDRF